MFDYISGLFQKSTNCISFLNLEKNPFTSLEVQYLNSFCP